MNPSIFEGVAFPPIEKLDFQKFRTPIFTFAEYVAERVLQAHPTNLKCLSKFTLDVEDPNSYQLILDLITKFKQIGPRVTEFKAVVSNMYIRLSDRKEGSFKTIEKSLEQMTNLKSLELDGDPYDDKCNETRPYPLDKF